MPCLTWCYLKVKVGKSDRHRSHHLPGLWSLEPHLQDSRDHAPRVVCLLHRTRQLPSGLLHRMHGDPQEGDEGHLMPFSLISLRAFSARVEAALSATFTFLSSQLTQVFLPQQPHCVWSVVSVRSTSFIRSMACSICCARFIACSFVVGGRALSSPT